MHECIAKKGFTLYGGRMVELKRNFKKPLKCLVVGMVGVWEARGKTFSSSYLAFLPEAQVSKCRLCTASASHLPSF